MIEKIISDLPKYLRIEGRYIYQLVMIKNDWDFTFPDSYIVMYAKENSKSYSSVNYLVRVTGKTFESAITNMNEKINELRKEGMIKGKEWIGDKPKEKDAQIKEKDAQIGKLLGILEKD